MSDTPTFAEFVEKFFPDVEVPEFHKLHIERISEMLQKVEQGGQVIITGGRYKLFYLNLLNLYNQQKDNGFNADTVIVDDCIAMPGRLHEADEPGHVFKSGDLAGLKQIKLNDESK